MISEMLSRVLGQGAEGRQAAADPAAGVAFRATSRTFFRGRPLEAGAVIEVPLAEAAEVSSWRLQLVNDADAERVRAECHRQAHAAEKGQRLAGVPWLRRVG